MKGANSHAVGKTVAALKGSVLVKNMSWTFIGNLVYVLCQWGMLVVLAKLGNPQMVGKFALGLAVAAPIVLFSNLALRQVQATDTTEEYSFADYLGLRLATTVVAFLTICVLGFVLGYSRETSLVIIIVGLAKSVEAISDVLYGLLQQRERMELIGRSMIIKGTLSLLLLGLGVYFTDTALWGVVGLVIAWALVLAGYDLRNGKLVLENAAETTARIRPRWRPGTLLKLSWLTLPLGIVAAAASFNVNLPRYMIVHFLGEREVGIFAAMAYVVIAGNVVVGALGQSSAPRLASYYNQDKPSFDTLLIKLLLLAVGLGMVGIMISMLVGKEVLSLVYTPEYARYADVFVWVMAAAGAGYVASIARYGMTAARQLRAQVPLVAVASIIILGGCYLLIPVQGLTGAAQALLAGTMAQVIGSIGVLSYSKWEGKLRSKRA